MSDYPEHNKLSAIKEQSEAIGAFLEWLSEQRIELARYEDAASSDEPQDLIVGHTPDGQPIYVNDETGEESPFVRAFRRRANPDYWHRAEGYYPIHKRIEAILAEYFEIDLNALEQEKRAMLNTLRAEAQTNA